VVEAAWSTQPRSNARRAAAVVYHHAAIASGASVEDPRHAVNAPGPERPEAARRGARRFVFASSSAVYGMTASAETREMPVSASPMRHELSSWRAVRAPVRTRTVRCATSTSSGTPGPESMYAA
jgi:nucleoside-diphosphate-sugar epimerase